MKNMKKIVELTSTKKNVRQKILEKIPHKNPQVKTLKENLSKSIIGQEQLVDRLILVLLGLKDLERGQSIRGPIIREFLIW